MNWIKAHPFQAVSFTAYNVFVATMAGMRPDLWVAFLIMFILGLFVFVLLFHIYKPLMVFLVALLMFDGAPPMTAAQRKGGEVVVGVVVICAGAYCVYRLARFCNQHFPKPPGTNDVNKADFIPGQECGVSYAVSTSCEYGEESGSPSPTSFTINALVQDGELLTRCSASPETASMEEFMAGVTAHGLTATGSAEMNRSTVPLSSVPIGSGYNGVAGTDYIVSVQISDDAQNWRELFTTTAGEGTAFQVVDTLSARAAFYRVELR